MIVSYENTPWKFLMEESKGCDNLKDFVKENNVTEEQFNFAVDAYVMFKSNNMRGDVNDIFRYDWKTIVFILQDDFKEE